MRGVEVFQQIWSYGNDIIEMVRPLSEWLLNEYEIPLLNYNGENWSVTGSYSASMIELLIGTGLIGLLTFKLVKWLLDIVL